ncbi:hypothetical protein IWQ49_004218 [Labrenzia sp. EL_126]|nr:hypothetical protein [Labrenzia sp. EL_126]
MTVEHLEILETAFARNHWIVDRRMPGDGYFISEVWHLTRVDGTGALTVEFDGLNELECLPIEKSYGCDIVEIANSGLYFSKIRASRWPKDLALFEMRIKEFNQMDW